MLPAVLAALAWGLSDVLTGVASRRASPLMAALWLYLVSLLLLAPFMVHADVWTGLSWRDVGIAACAGVAGVAGDIFYGRSLVRSAMSLGIPLCAVVTTAVPVAVALALGEHLTWSSGLGLGGALIASLLAAWPQGGHAESRGALSALTGGLLFGVMFGLLVLIKNGNALLLIFLMRAAGLLAMLPQLARMRLRGPDLMASGAFAGALSGVTSVVANLLFLVALGHSTTTAASAVAVGLSAPFGVVIAHLSHRERLTRAQTAAALLAMASIVVLGTVHA